MVLGSKRAEVHTWEFNTVTRTLTRCTSGRRQTKKADPRLDTEALADELVRLIESGANDRRHAWNPDRDQVRVLMDEAIPMTNRQTTQERRKRFAKAMRERAAIRGWPEVQRYTFRVRSGS
jgi:hypothetical protein